MAVKDVLMPAVSLPDLSLYAVALVGTMEVALGHRDEYLAGRRFARCRFIVLPVGGFQRHIDQTERKRSHASALAATEEAVDELLVVQPFCFG